MANKKPRLLQVVWDIVKEGNITKMTYKFLDQLFRRDLESRRLKRVEGFYDIWTSSLNISNYSKAASKVFGEMVEGNENYIRRAINVLANLSKPEGKSKTN